MGEQDYVIGFEPCNCGVEGRQIDEDLGLLHTLKAGESKTVSLEFGAVTTQKELRALKAARAKVKTEIVKSYKQFVRKPSK
jgi:hypothetical protein